MRHWDPGIKLKIEGTVMPAKIPLNRLCNFNGGEWLFPQHITSTICTYLLSTGFSSFYVVKLGR